MAVEGRRSRRALEASPNFPVFDVHDVLEADVCIIVTANMFLLFGLVSYMWLAFSSLHAIRIAGAVCAWLPRCTEGWRKAA